MRGKGGTHIKVTTYLTCSQKETTRGSNKPLMVKIGEGDSENKRKKNAQCEGLWEIKQRKSHFPKDQLRPHFM
jgi:hypothetical protein